MALRSCHHKCCTILTVHVLLQSEDISNMMVSCSDGPGAHLLCFFQNNNKAMCRTRQLFASPLHSSNTVTDKQTHTCRQRFTRPAFVGLWQETQASAGGTLILPSVVKQQLERLNNNCGWRCRSSRAAGLRMLKSHGLFFLMLRWPLKITSSFTIWENDPV